MSLIPLIPHYAILKCSLYAIKYFLVEEVLTRTTSFIAKTTGKVLISTIKYPFRRLFEYLRPPDKKDIKEITEEWILINLK